MEKLMRTAAALAMEYRQPRLAVSMPRLFPPNCWPSSAAFKIPKAPDCDRTDFDPSARRSESSFHSTFLGRGPSVVHTLALNRAGAGEQSHPLWRASGRLVLGRGRPDAFGRVRARW